MSLNGDISAFFVCFLEIDSGTRALMLVWTFVWNCYDLVLFERAPLRTEVIIRQCGYKTEQNHKPSANADVFIAQYDSLSTHFLQWLKGKFLGLVLLHMLFRVGNYASHPVCVRACTHACVCPPASCILAQTASYSILRNVTRWWTSRWQVDSSECKWHLYLALYKGDQTPQFQPWILRAKQTGSGDYFYSLWSDPAGDGTDNLPVSGRHSTLLVVTSFNIRLH